MYGIERDVYMAAMTNLDAQSGLHVSPITALWRSEQPSCTYRQFRFGIPGGWVVPDT